MGKKLDWHCKNNFLGDFNGNTVPIWSNSLNKDEQIKISKLQGGNCIP